MPASLHRDLAEQASEEGVSLNTYLLYLITKSYGNQMAPMTEPVTESNGLLMVGVDDQTYNSTSSVLVIPNTSSQQ